MHGLLLLRNTDDFPNALRGKGNVAGWQPCLTHPKAVDVAVEYARGYFSKRPDDASISLGVNDGGRYCECERCMKLVDDSLDHEERRSRWFFQFANAVAKRFDEEFPDKLIGYLLYGECKRFPKLARWQAARNVGRFRLSCRRSLSRLLPSAAGPHTMLACSVTSYSSQYIPGGGDHGHRTHGW